MRKCVLEDKMCVNCGECDACDLDGSKTCDNCGKCIQTDAEYAEIKIDEVEGGG